MKERIIFGLVGFLATVAMLTAFVAAEMHPEIFKALAYLVAGSGLTATVMSAWKFTEAEDDRL